MASPMFGYGSSGMTAARGIDRLVSISSILTLTTERDCPCKALLELSQVLDQLRRLEHFKFHAGDAEHDTEHVERIGPGRQHAAIVPERLENAGGRRELFPHGREGRSQNDARAVRERR